MCEDEFAATETVRLFTRMSEEYSALLMGSAEDLLKTANHRFKAPFIPIERILLNSVPATDLECAAATRYKDSVAVALTNGQIFWMISNSGSIIEIQGQCATQLALRSEDQLVVFTQDSKIKFFNTCGNETYCYSQLNKQIKMAVAISPSNMVLSTSCDHSLYIWKAGSHQLLIGSNLDEIFSLQFFPPKSLLAVLAKKFILILDMSVPEKPFLVCKLALPADLPVSLCWLHGGGGSLVLLSGEEVFSLSPPFFNQVKLTCVNKPQLHAGVAASLIAVTGDTVCLVHADCMHLFQVEIACNSARFLDAEPHHLPSAHLRIVPNCFGAPVMDSSLTICGVKQNKVEIFKVSFLKWIEIALSLTHCEKFEPLLDLLQGLAAGEIPALIDGSAEQICGDSHLLIEVSEKYIKSEKFDVEFFCIFAAKFRLIETFIHLLLPVIPPLVIAGRVPADSLSQPVVSAVVEAKNIDLSQLDLFLAKVTLERGPNLIDTNKIVRVAAALNLKLTSVLVHIYLLHDTLFPITYLEADQRFFYLYSLSRSFRYPCWDGAHQYPGSSSILDCRSDLIQSLYLSDQERFLDSVGYDIAVFTRLVEKNPLTDALVSYAIKAAVSRGSLQGLFQQIPQNKCFQTLLKRGETPLLLKCLDTVRTSTTDLDLVLILNQLLSTGCKDSEIFKFLTQFKHSLQLDKVVGLLKDKQRSVLAINLLAERRDFDSAIKIMQQLEDKRPLLDFTQKFASYIDPANLVSLWADFIQHNSSALDDVIVRALLASAVDLASLAHLSSDIQTQSKLIGILQSTQDLLIHSSCVSAIDVGEQFAKLAKQDSMKNKGVSITPSICHVCLDPISDSNRTDLFLFSCGHIMHSSCGVTSACSVCV